MLNASETSIQFSEENPASLPRKSDRIQQLEQQIEIWETFLIYCTTSSAIAPFTSATARTQDGYLDIYFNRHTYEKENRGC